MPSEKKNKVGNWSVEKLELLRKYLKAYTTILSKQEWCEAYYYIDAFAGQGWWLADEDGEEKIIKGSPAVALEVNPPFSWYVFIEQDVNRAAELERLKEQYPDKAKYIQVIQDDANSVLQERIIPRMSGVGGRKSPKRGFIFLDPYTTNVEWETIQRIQRTKVLEIFLNFPIMAPNRAILWNNPDRVNAESLARMDRFWGSPEWREYVYEEAQSMFGPVQKKVAKAGEKLAYVFQSRLGQLFEQVTAPVIMKNSKNSALYCLMFAGPKPVGQLIAQDIFDDYVKGKSKITSKRLSKKEPPGQQSLFDSHK